MDTTRNQLDSIIQKLIDLKYTQLISGVGSPIQFQLVNLFKEREYCHLVIPNSVSMNERIRVLAIYASSLADEIRKLTQIALMKKNEKKRRKSS